MASPTKQLVREYIRKLQNKALAAVEKKHSALFDEAVVVYLAEENPCLRDSLSECHELLEKANAIIVQVRALVSGSNWVKRFNWASKPDIYGSPDIKQMLFSAYVPVGTQLEKICFDWIEEKARVSDSYVALQRYLESNSASSTVTPCLLINIPMGCSNLDTGTGRTCICISFSAPLRPALPVIAAHPAATLTIEADQAMDHCDEDNFAAAGAADCKHVDSFRPPSYNDSEATNLIRF